MTGEVLAALEAVPTHGRIWAVPIHGRIRADGDARAAAQPATHAVHGARARCVVMDARDTHSRSRCRSIGVPRRRARVKAQTGKKRNLQFVAVLTDQSGRRRARRSRSIWWDGARGEEGRGRVS